MEIATGRSHADLDTKATINNALAVHRALMVNGFRYRPEYEIQMDVEPIPVNRNDLLDSILASEGVLGIEQALLEAKLDAVSSRFRRGTLIYTHYVEGMVGPTRNYLEGMNFRVGVYTGGDKSGLKLFLDRKVEVLIGSRPVGTGVDGLQSVCDQLILLSLPWTGAEYEQIIGRIYRRGSAYEKVSVIVPEVILEYAGHEWSWDRGRMATIRYKRTLSECAVDGTIPDAVRISEHALLRQSREALERWIARIGEEGLLEVERARLTVPLPPDIRRKVEVRRGDLATMNQRWATSKSETVHERLKESPEEWYLYHTLYREARESWAEIPAEHIASKLASRTDLKVGDFGCGEGLLKKTLPNHEVIGLDHVAIDETVIACDMAHTPLEDASLGAAVFSLSLMGTNWRDYLKEARRVLQPYGLLFVAEPARKWGDGKLEAALEGCGFSVVGVYQRDAFRYVQAVSVD